MRLHTLTVFLFSTLILAGCSKKDQTAEYKRLEAALPVISLASFYYNGTPFPEFQPTAGFSLYAVGFIKVGNTADKLNIILRDTLGTVLENREIPFTAIIGSRPYEPNYPSLRGLDLSFSYSSNAWIPFRSYSIEARVTSGTYVSEPLRFGFRVR